MASMNIHKEQPQNKYEIEVAPSAAKTPKEGAVGPHSGTPTPKIERTTSFLNEKPIAHAVNNPAVDTPSVHVTTVVGKRPVSVGSPSKADLMDLDIGQETLQPVLKFTASSTKKGPDGMVVEKSSSFDQKIEALERSGVLSATQLEALRTIQAQVHARNNPLTPMAESSHQPIYSRSELDRVPKVSTGIARQFAEQQNAFLIGEHIHKTRYQTAASLTEDFKKLSIVDKKPAEPAAMDNPKTERLRMTEDNESMATKLSTTEKSKINPFGPPPTKGKGPSLPAHLLNRTSTADHGAAARTQYSYSNNLLAPVSGQQTLAGSNTPTRPTRRNKINETGFIALAENHAAGKK